MSAPREGAALREARRLFGWVHDEGLTRTPLLREVEAALLAFPGGDAEPVASRMACADGSTHSISGHVPTPSIVAIAEREAVVIDGNHLGRDCGPHRVQLLSAAPGAGDAGALLRDALAEIKRCPDRGHEIDVGGCFYRIEQCLAALAPAGSSSSKVEHPDG